jgi:osmoprotectant transport system substrate-binding protein
MKDRLQQIQPGSFALGPLVESARRSCDVGRIEEGIPQGLRPRSVVQFKRPKAEALGYLEALGRKFGGRLFVFLAVLGVVWQLCGCAPPKSSRIAIGAKNFTEQVVLGELLAQEIEAVTGEPVERRFYLAGSYLCQQALVSGRIDGYVEYTGTALTAILKQPLPPVGQRDEATVFRQVSELYASRYRVKVGWGLGFEDTFAMVVRGEDARRLGLRTISDAVRVAEPTSQNRDVGHPDPPPPWRLGVGYEFQSRPDGLRGLEATYGLKFDGAPRTMDLGLLYRALSSGQVDMVAGNSTDGPIRALGFVVLEDDRHYFPPYEAVPLVRFDSLRRHPGIGVAMDRLAGKVSAEEVRGMNYAVDSEHRDVGDVVREFRRGKGL